MEKRLDDMEIRLTFQDRTIEELNEALISQQQQIDKMQKELEVLRAQLRTLPDMLAGRDEDPLPPHY